MGSPHGLNTYPNTDRGFSPVKVVPDGYHKYFFGVKIKAVKLVVGRRFFAVRSGLKDVPGGMSDFLS